MSSLVLKIIAIIAMALDHVGYFLDDPNIPHSYEIYLAFRIVGRLAMPIFCFMIAEGFRKTRDPYRYAMRLAGAAIISEIPFNICFFGSPIATGSLNVMFSLLLGLLGLICYKLISDNTEIKAVALMPVAVVCLAAHYLGADYGFYAPLFIFLFYLSSPDTLKGRAFTLLVTLLFGAREIIEYAVLKTVSLLTSIVSFLPTLKVEELTDWSYIQIFAAAALILLLFYNGKLGRKPENKLAQLTVKYSFYLFYPIHLIIIWIIFGIVLRN